MSVDGLKGDEVPNLGQIPISPTLDADQFLSSKLSSRPEKGGSNSRKKKFLLAKTDCTATSEELAKLLIHAVLKPGAYIGEEEALGLVIPLTAWLNLHGIATQTKLRLMKNFYLHNIIVGSKSTHIVSIVEAVAISYLDTIVELATVLDYHYFRTKFLQNNTNYQAMLDHYKEKGQTALQEMMQKENRTYGTNSKIPTLDIAPYMGDVYSAEELMTNIESAFKIQ